MLYSIFSAALLAGLTVAQYAGLPSCAQDCASDQFTGGSYGDCGTDPECICSDGDFLDTIACCLVGACDAADQTSAISFAQQICQANGVSVPSTATCSTAAGSASGTATGTLASTSATATGTLASTSATATGTGTAADTATATGATGTAGSTAASAAWAPRQTAGAGVGLLGGLAAAGLMML